MTEEEAKNLLLQNWREIQDKDAALCVTQRMITEGILRELVGETASPEAMMNLRMLADAKSRLDYYMHIAPEATAAKSRDFFEGFVNVVELWEEAMAFAVNNYEAENIKENTHRSKEEMAKVLRDTEAWRRRLQNHIQENGCFTFYGWECKLLNWLIDWVVRLIIGYNPFDKYAREYSKIIAYLNLLARPLSQDSPSEYIQ